MNKIYKTKRNALGQQVVTSELAKNAGKLVSAVVVSVATVGVAHANYPHSTTLIDGVAGQSDAHAGVASVAIGSALPYTNAQGETSTTKATAPLSIAIGLGATAAKSATLPADSTNPTNPNFADPLAAVAIGASSVASGYTSVAYGYRARATDRVAVAVGPDARAAGYASTAIGNGSYAKDMSTTALGNYAYAEGFQAVAVGASRHAEGLKATGTQAILLGTSDNADLTQDELMGPGYADGANPWSEYTGTDLGTAQPTVVESRSSIVSGKNALGIGVAVKSTAEQAIAQGYYANASAKDSIAIGTLTKTGENAVDSVVVGPRSSVTSAKSNAFGSVNTITGANSTAIGNNNVIASEKVMVLGNNVNVTSGFNGSVVLGDSSAAAKAEPTASHTWFSTTGKFAGVNPTSTVSVGAEGAERQITNVAAGRISATSTDAINGSQLYVLGAALETELDNVNANATKPLTFMGDTGTAFERKLGTQTNVVGGATANLTDNNIGVVADGTDTLTVKLAEKINLGTTGSVTMGDTVVNNQGLTITNGPSITNVGINAGGTQITNVASGGNVDTNAANIGDVKNLIANSNANINNRINALDDELAKQNKQRKASAASALAAAGLPQPHREGQSGLVAAVGQYQSQVGLAVGYARVSDNGKWIIRAAATTNSQREFGSNFGVGYFW
ncbi:YadA-like family protein [Pelistega suis]|uniref:YadA-like family protein n=1 Tax=Pelistega suis TaxID=1631957 RepID=UPI00211CF656|nr:YadA-like family protein [Pelistega suis]MCQ9328351.1 YadA-like family protein [Pelistega suis]